MSQLEQIRELWSRTKNAGKSAVLATVVKTQGSSYRLPGARLLVTPDGRRAGSISGGCLEDDLVKKAWWLTEGGPIVRRYDTTPDGEIGPSFGLGCNGIIHVLLERIYPDNTSALDLVDEVELRRRPAAIAHVLQPREFVGQRLVIDTARAMHCGLSGEEKAWLEQQTQLSLVEMQSRTASTDDGLEAFFEVLTPPIQVLIFGAGDDAIPVVELAKYFGWRVVVLDGRAHYARREKFPQADEVGVRKLGQWNKEVRLDPWTAAILMTHSYSQDLEILGELGDANLSYLGVLGPRKRTMQLLEEAGLSAAAMSAPLHSPMGLDIGADGPEQVALAILSEIQATFNGRRGGFLRERIGPIHSGESAAGFHHPCSIASTTCA